MWPYALTTLAGAFLLFQVQPLLGKYILPWFGGAPGVWTTCLLFFQWVLLGGYAYAHLSARWLKPRAQLALHLLLVGAALALLPITPAETWKPSGEGNPLLQILGLLTACIGLPFFVLSATGPLLQHWFSHTHPGRSPFRLYALSNFGSLLALVSFPFVFEPHFTRTAQTTLWAGGFGLYALGCAWCARRLWKAEVRMQNDEVKASAPDSERSTLHAPRFTPLPHLLWLLLPACASVLLLATTNKMCQEVAVIPFLWVLPLSLYLVSFIICFDSPRWYERGFWGTALLAALAALGWALVRGNQVALLPQLAIYAAGLFICCMVCHGELYRLRPEPQHLTGFYLLIAAGGALGGLFVAVLAPVLFTDFFELQWGLLLCGALFLFLVARSHGHRSWRREDREWRTDVAHRRNRPLPSRYGVPALAGGASAVEERDALPSVLGRGSSLPAKAGTPNRGQWPIAPVAHSVRKPYRPAQNIGAIFHSPFPIIHHPSSIIHLPSSLHRLAPAALAVYLLGFAGALWWEAHRQVGPQVERTRSFYGVLTVLRRSNPQAGLYCRELMHGRTSHGLQLLDAQRAAWPTTYFGEKSGIGLALSALPAEPRRLGVLGLGVGTLAAYARPGDYLHFYEINPQIPRLAQTWFSYLAHCPAQVDITLGDGRLSLEREAPQDFDLLVLDAFNSDAVPMHLLTQEAFTLYARHLKPNGLIAMDISNRSVDLEPVAANLARCFGYQMAVVDCYASPHQPWLYGSTWVLLSHSGEIVHSATLRAAARPNRFQPGQIPLWRDDFASLFQVLRRDRPAPAAVAEATKALAQRAHQQLQRGNFAGALAQYQLALQRQPEAALMLVDYSLALALAPAPQRNVPQAIQLMEQACDLTRYAVPPVVGALAVVYSEAGRFPEAIQMQEKACFLTRDLPEPALGQKNQGLLEWYRARRPYHESPWATPAIQWHRISHQGNEAVRGP